MLTAETLAERGFEALCKNMKVFLFCADEVATSDADEVIATQGTMP